MVWSEEEIPLELLLSPARDGADVEDGRADGESDDVLMERLMDLGEAIDAM